MLLQTIEQKRQRFRKNHKRYSSFWTWTYRPMREEVANDCLDVTMKCALCEFVIMLLAEQRPLRQRVLYTVSTLVEYFFKHLMSRLDGAVTLTPLSHRNVPPRSEHKYVPDSRHAQHKAVGECGSSGFATKTLMHTRLYGT